MAVWSPSGSGNVHRDVVLTNISLGYPMAGMVAPTLFPAVPVQKQSNKYNVFGREGWLPSDGDYRAPGTVANEIPGMKLSEDTYFANEHALQIAVTDEERENADSPLSPDRDGTELVTSKIVLGREKTIKDMVTTVGNYASGFTVTLSGTTQWNDYTNSNPISDMRTGKAAVHASLFMEPNTVMIPYQVMTILEDHPDFIERIKYSERGIITAEIIAAMLGFANIVVPGVGIAAGNPGQALTVSYLWGKDVIMAWVPSRPGMKIPAFGYEFVWGYGGSAQAVDRWREDPRKSDLVRVSRRYDLKFVGVDSSGDSIAGYLIKNAIA